MDPRILAATTDIGWRTLVSSSLSILAGRVIPRRIKGANETHPVELRYSGQDFFSSTIEVFIFLLTDPSLEGMYRQ